jgi:hypothetical protein
MAITRAAPSLVLVFRKSFTIHFMDVDSAFAGSIAS